MKFSMRRIYTRGALPLAATCALVRYMNQSMTSVKSDEAPSSNKSNLLRRKKRFVIVGAGVAGKACIYQLLRSNPRVDKDILLIDPCPDTLHFAKESNTEIETTSVNIVDLNVEGQTLELSSGEVIEYDKCLLAMGKATGMISPNFITPNCSQKHVIYINASSCREQLELLKHHVMNNRHVTLLGGSWSALSIASYLAKHQVAPGLVTMVLPGSAPLHQVLPRYLSEALLQRLVKQGIDVLNYTQVRYVGSKETLHLNGNGGGGSSLQLDGDFVVMHVCCSYDSLRTSMFPTDVVVLSAEKDLEEGLYSDHHNNQEYNIEVSNDVLKPSLSRTWLYQSGLEVDRYGSVIVNKALLAAENIYVAGDLASYPYSTSIETASDSRKSQELISDDRSKNKSKDVVVRDIYKRGHDVGLINAEQTGQVAARNMSQDRGHGGRKCVMPYYQAVAPYSGLNFLFFGDCSNRYASHSYWLKPSSPVSSRTKTSSKSNSSVSPAAHSSDSVKSSDNSSMKNLFGKAGVVFYVDSSNVIRGIMLSGNDGIIAAGSTHVGDSRGDKLGEVSPFKYIGKNVVPDANMLAVQVVRDKLSTNHLQNLAYSLLTAVNQAIDDHTNLSKSLEITDRPPKHQPSIILDKFNKIKSKDVHTIIPAVKYIYSRPRALNGSVVTGSKSLLNPLNVSIKGSSFAHPWRYFIQSSELSEPIFYRNSKRLE